MTADTHPALISVIMAVKDGASYLRQAIESVLGQTYSPLELLVVDGHSSDASVSIAQSYPAVRVLFQPGSGLADAWNLGVQRSCGSYLAFIDSDDLWDASKLALQVRQLLRHPRSGYVVGKVRFFTEAGLPAPPGFRPELLDEPRLARIPGTLLARRAFFEQVGLFDTSYPIAADVDWFSRAQELEAPQEVVEILLHKRVHHRNLSSDVTRNNRDLLRIMRRSARSKNGLRSDR